MQRTFWRRFCNSQKPLCDALLRTKLNTSTWAVSFKDTTTGFGFEASINTSIYPTYFARAYKQNSILSQSQKQFSFSLEYHSKIFKALQLQQQSKYLSSLVFKISLSCIDNISKLGYYLKYLFEILFWNLQERYHLKISKWDTIFHQHPPPYKV